MQFSNKENANPNQVLKKLKELKADKLKKQEQSATNELDEIYKIYSEHLVPKMHEVIMGQLKIDYTMEKRIRLEEARIK
jgi:3-methyladenine DNA glycosylase AlkC